MTWSILILTAVVLSGCGSPVGVTRVDPEIVNYQLTRNAISDGVPSRKTDIVLHIADLTETYAHDPRGALKTLHTQLLGSDRPGSVAFALAELS